MKKYLAELLGTFFLTFIVGASVAGKFPLPTPLLAGLTLMTFVYTTGSISGTHINPAVTIALWTHRQIELMETLMYLISQMIGAFAASFALFAFGLETKLSPVQTMRVGIAESVGALLFGYGIYAVVGGSVERSMSGIVIGTSLLLGVAVAALIGSNGVLNPAVAFGIGSFNLMYLFGPIVGMSIGMWIHRALLHRHKSE